MNIKEKIKTSDFFKRLQNPDEETYPYLVYLSHIITWGLGFSLIFLFIFLILAGEILGEYANILFWGAIPLIKLITIAIITVTIVFIAAKVYVSIKLRKKDQEL